MGGTPGIDPGLLGVLIVILVSLQPGVYAQGCSDGTFGKKMLDIDNTKSDFSYVTMPESIPDMTEFTMCFWVRSSDAITSRYLMTYRSSNINSGSIYLYNPNNVQLYVNNGAASASGMVVSYGVWHHLCITWDSADSGRYHYYKDGRMRYTSYNLKNSQTILGGGTMIFGQWQASIGGGFSKSYSFNAEMSAFNIWNERMDVEAIQAMADNPCEANCGNAVSWASLSSSDLASVTVEDFDIRCEPEKPTCARGDFKDKTWELDSSAEFTYAELETEFRDMWAFTACWWMRTNDVGNYRAVMSYFAEGDNPGSIILETPQNLRASIKNSWSSSSGISVTYGLWHHVCLAWTSEGGVLNIFKDGSKAFTQSNYRTNLLLRGGGKLIIGQRQGSIGGGFNRAYSYLGDISEFNMWDSLIESNDIKGYSENRGCENGCGNLVSWHGIAESALEEVKVVDAEATCENRVTECDAGEFQRKVFDMDNSDDFAYAQSFQTMPDMNEFTMCFWVRSHDASTSRYLMTYRSSNINSGSIYLYNPNNVQLYVNNGAASASGMVVSYGVWHHLCITWDSADSGRYHYYKDGRMRYTSYNLKNSQTILGDGTLILGTWQASIGGGFSKSYSFNAEMTKFNIWSEKWSSDAIQALAENDCDLQCGDAISWSHFRSTDISSAVVVKNSDMECEPEEPVCSDGDFKDKAWKMDSSSEYSYAELQTKFRDMWAFTACWWMRTNDVGNYRAVMSYFAEGDNPGSIILETPQNLRASIKNSWSSSSGISVTYGLWHHVCLAWTSEGGVLNIFKDGSKAFTQSNYRTNLLLRGGGKLIIGQRQGSIGGGFNRAYSYLGDVLEFNMWSDVLPITDIQGFAQNRGCDNGCGDLVSWHGISESSLVEAEVVDAESICDYNVPTSYVPPNLSTEDRVTECGSGEYERTVMEMDNSDDFAYAQSYQSIKEMSEFTMCFWVRSHDTTTSRYLMTYRSSNINSGSIYLYNPNNVQLYVNNGAATASGTAVNYGVWHHMCFTWDSADSGRYKYFKDGVMRYTSYNLKNNQVILGGGSLILGQWQASVGGGFSKSYSFNCEMTKFNIWSEKLGAEDIQEMAIGGCDNNCGDVVSWSYFRSTDIPDSVKMKDSNIKCEPDEPVCSGGAYEEKSITFDSTSEYSYAIMKKEIRDLWEFTACWWMRTDDTTSTYHTMMSYFAQGDSVSSILVENPYNLRAVIKNQWGSSTTVAVNYGMWHHVCLSWAGEDGIYNVYRDGGVAYTQSGYSKDKIIRGGGTLVLGQRQGSIGGGFSKTYSYAGEMSDFNMWNTCLVSDDIKGFVENRGCENGCGNLISWDDFTSSDLVEVDVENSDAICEARQTECGKGDFDDKKFDFDGTTNSYASVMQEIPEMSAATVCMWIKTTQSTAAKYIFTYRTSNINAGSMYLYNPTNLQFYVDNAAGTNSGIAINYGLWFHTCMTWTSASGKYQYFKDARLRYTNTGLRTNYKIAGGGSFIIGQWQASIGGQFGTSYPFDGEIAKFNMWSKVLPDADIEAMFAEPCGYMCGDVISWTFFRSDDIAGITIGDSDVQCEEEEVVCSGGPYTNKTWTMDSSAEYTYTVVPAEFPDMWAFTSCWWMRTNDVGNSRVMMSYFAQGDNPGSIILETPKNLRACVKNSWASSSGISITYGLWHHVCLTWSSDGGVHEIYKDGSRAFTQTGYRTNLILKGGGQLIIGQRQGSIGGGFNRAYSYLGEISDFNMWEEVLLSSKIQDFSSNRGCENGCGTLVSWADITSSALTEVEVNDAESVCQPRVSTCEGGEFERKVLDMDNSGDYAYAQSYQNIPDMNEFTMCFWVRSRDATTSRYLMTYRSSNINSGSIYSYNPNNVQLYVNNGAATASGIIVNYGLWHHLCFTWDSADSGRYHYYKDGVMRYTSYNLKNNQAILGGGTLIIGTWQASIGGGFSKSHSFNAEMTQFNIWGEAKNSEAIQAMSTNDCGSLCGDIVSWAYFRSSDVSSTAVIKDSDIKCVKEVPVCARGELEDKSLVMDSSAEYTYAQIATEIPDHDLWEFTACWWMRTNDVGSYRVMMSYFAQGDNPGSIILETPKNLRASIKNSWSSSSGISVTYGLWHHVCFAWTSEGGELGIFKDGSRAFTQSNYRTNLILKGGGQLIIGQRQGSIGGGFNRAYSYLGDISEFNMWKTVLASSDIQAFAENRGCENGCGDLVSWHEIPESAVIEAKIVEAEAICKERNTDCEGGEFDGKVLNMDNSENYAYIQSYQTIPDMNEFTMCFWVRSRDTTATRYIMTYRSSNINTGSIYVYNPTNVQLYINNGAATGSSVAVNYGVWHHLCFTWDSADSGRYHYYKDGVMRYTSYNLKNNQAILGGGTLILGTWQASIGGGFSKSYSFNAEMTKFNIWSDVMSAENIQTMAVGGCDANCGDIISWSYFRHSDVSSAVVIQDSDIKCEPEEPVCSDGRYEGKTLIFDSTSEYSYAIMEKEIRDLWEFTACWWMRTEDTTSTYHTMMSYFAQGDSVSSILLENPYNLRASIKNQWGSSTTVAVNYGMWHHVCLSWAGEDGIYNVYRDGGVAYTQGGYSKDKIIRGGGSLVLGQRQGSIGGKFSKTYSYAGEISDFNMWNTQLDSSDIKARELECGKGDFDDKKFEFDGTTNSYASVMQEIPEMSAATVCMWIKTTQSTAAKYIFTYRTSNINAGSMYLYNPTNIQFYVDNAAGANSGIAINYGLWFHTCMTWTSENGKYQYFKDGRLRYTNTGLRTNYKIAGGGAFIIGQWQASIGGQFGTSYPFNGEIAKFNMWSEVLADVDIEKMFTEPCGYTCGDVISWTFFRQDDIAGITVEDSDVQCEEEVVTCDEGAYTNKTWIMDSSAEYTYATAPVEFVDMWAFTACFWMKTNDEGSSRAMMSYYAHGDSTGSIVFETPKNLRACIQNTWATSSGISTTYGLWHHVCVTWSSDGGVHEIYKDGSRAFTQNNFKANLLLKGGGTLIIGQRQGSIGGGFNRAYSYNGGISDFNMWDNVVMATEIKRLAENRGCKNGCGNLLPWTAFKSSALNEVEVEDAESDCQPRVTKCGEGKFERTVLDMDNTGDYAYAQSYQTIPDMNEFTMCFWVRSRDITASRYIMTYRSSNINTGSIYVYNPTNVQLYVNNGAATGSSVAVNYGVWHHLCFTWDSADSGRYHYYKDGVMRYTSYNLKNNQAILGGGTLILGTWQASIGGGFSKSYSFNGEMTKFNIWSELLDPQDIQSMAIGGCDVTCGDEISWSYFRPGDVSSAVELKDSDIKCALEEPICTGGSFEDNSLSFDSSYEYAYVTSEKEVRDLWEFTTCWWMRTEDTSSTRHTMMSYFAQGDSVSSILLENPYNLRAAIKNSWGSSSTVAVNYGMWHHVCLSWSEKDGIYNIYRDGGVAYTQSGYALNKILRGGGKLVLGQKQGSLGGGFSKSYSYTGELSDFNMWNIRLDSDVIRAFVENRGCDNGCGNIILWDDFTRDESIEVDIDDKEAVCTHRITECGKGEFDDKQIVLDGTTKSYASVMQEIQEMSAATVCMWIKTTQSTAAKYIFTYRTSNINAGSMYLYNPTNLQFYVDNAAGTNSGIAINYGLWFHTCMTWTSASGKYQYFKDARLRYTNTGLRTNYKIAGGGSFIIGQWQASIGGQFGTSYPFDGEIAKFNMWSEALSDADIEAMFIEPCGYSCGNVISWTFFRSDDVAGIDVKDSDVECEKEETVCTKGDYTGKSWTFDSSDDYSYVTVSKDFVDIWAFTACWWMRTSTTTSSPVMMHYFAPGDSYGSIIVESPHNLRAMIKNTWASSSSVSVTHGIWHHVCITWSSDGGIQEFYRDGSRTYLQNSLKTDTLLKGGGTLILGQRQRIMGGNFLQSDAYLGEMSDFNMWDEVLLSSKIYTFSENIGCDNGCGNLVSWSDFISADLTEVEVDDGSDVCEERVTECNGGDLKDKVLDMDNSGDFAYGQSFQKVPDLTKFTMCFWVRSEDKTTSKYLMHYRTNTLATGSFYVYNPNNVQMYINNGAATASGVAVNYGLWHHMCFTWDSFDSGRYHYYKDGLMRYTSYNLKNNQDILGGGVLILGQRQGLVGGSFSKTYSFNAEMTKFDIWSDVLDVADIQNMANDGCDSNCGDVISWPFFRPSDVSEAVTITDSDIECGPQKTVCSGGDFTKKVWTFDSSAEYTYVTSDIEMPDLSEFSMCFWARTDDLSTAARSMMSYYAYGDSVGSIVIENPYILRVAIKNTWSSSTSVSIRYGLWNHVCTTWKSEGGVVQLYKNGALAFEQQGIKTDQIIRGAGSLIIGQKQGSMGGGFNRAYSYIGDMSDFNMWTSVLDHTDIMSHAAERGCDNGCGELISWHSFIEENLVEVEVEDSNTDCKQRVSDCEGGQFDGKAWSFTSTDTTDWSFVQANKVIERLSALTACWWSRTTDGGTSRHFFSYATRAVATGSFFVRNMANVQMVVNNGAATASGVPGNTGLWHHMCVTWSSTNGDYQYFKDTARVYSGTNLKKGATIFGGGSLVIGQVQNQNGIVFTNNYQFLGEMSQFNLWCSVLESSVILGVAESGCQPDCGDIIAWSFFRSNDLHTVDTVDFDVDCETRVSTCSGGAFDDKVFTFTSEKTSEMSVAMAYKEVPDLNAFTSCWWMRTSDVTTQARNVFSYRTHSISVGYIYVRYMHNMQLCVNNQCGTASSIDVRYGLWHHICVTWSSTNGEYKYFKDGVLSYSQDNLKTGNTILGRGTMLLGQQQNSVGGGFSTSTAYKGDLTDFNFWSKVMESDDLRNIGTTGCEKGCGDVIAWSYFRDGDIVNIDVTDSDNTCAVREKICSKGHYNGKVWRMGEGDSTDFTYGIVRKELPDLDEFSMCFWTKTYSTSDGFVMSYFSKSNGRLIEVRRPSNVYILVNGGSGSAMGTAVNYGLWHHICITWDSNNGVYQYFKDATLVNTFTGLRSGQMIKRGGSFIIGQYQTTVGGGFSSTYKYQGDLTSFNMWESVLEESAITNIAGDICQQTCGDLISWAAFRPGDVHDIKVLEYELDCVQEVITCSDGQFDNSTWNFNSEYEFTYVEPAKSFRDIDQFSVCWWMKTTGTDIRSSDAMFSYFATGDNTYNSIMVYDPYNLRTSIKNSLSSASTISVGYAQWHHVCLTWTRDSGIYKVYKDGSNAFTQTNFRTGEIIRGAGTLVIGQRQGSKGGGFNKAYSFRGEMTQFNMWTTVIDEDTISTIAVDRSCANGCGDLISWSMFSQNDLYEVEVFDDSSLGTCEPRIAKCSGGEYDNKVWSLDSTSVWSYGYSYQPVPDMDAFTACWWMRTTDTSSSRYIFSYMTSSVASGSIKVYNTANMQMLVNNQWGTASSTKTNNGRWHHYCVLWKANGGTYRYFKNSNLVYLNINLKTDQKILGGGALIVGQLQGNVGGGLNKANSYIGDISQFNLWSHGLESDDIMNVAITGCHTGCGNVIWWSYFRSTDLASVNTDKDFDVQCEPRHQTCQNGEFSDKTLIFEKDRNWSYAVVNKVIPDIEKFTMCWWVRTDDMATSGRTSVSYMTHTPSQGHISIRNFNNYMAYINNVAARASTIDVRTRIWHHVCFSWNSNGGTYRYYKDGGLAYINVNLMSGKIINGGGSLILGQDQASIGQQAAFRAGYEFIGEMTQFNMWSDVLEDEIITNIAVSGCMDGCGDIVPWSYLMSKDLNEVDVGDYTITCEPRVEECNKGEFVNSTLTFRDTTSDYDASFVSVRESIDDISEMSMCWWMRTTSTAVSYIATYNQASVGHGIAVYDPSNLRIMINGAWGSQSGKKYNYGLWHHACITWDNTDGKYQYYKDGRLVYENINLKKDVQIPKGGSFVLGNDQKGVGGVRFTSKNYNGEIAQFNVWSEVLDTDTLNTMHTDGCNPECGDVVNWASIRSSDMLNVEVNPTSIPCGPELPACYGGEFDDKKFGFDSTSEYSYAVSSREMPDIWAFTICYWVQTDDTSASKTMVQYSTQFEALAIFIQNPTNTQMYVRQGAGTSSGIAVNYNRWVHLCTSWDSSDGSYQYFLDGSLVKAFTNLQAGKVVHGGGQLMLGNRRNSKGGSFTGKGYSFIGQMANFNMWSKVLDDSAIERLSLLGCENGCGDIISWALFTSEDITEVEVNESEIECRYEPSCTGGTYENSTMAFDSTKDWSYAMVTKKIPDLEEFSVCYWMRTVDRSNWAGTMFSYFSPGSTWYGSIAVEYTHNMRMWIKTSVGSWSNIETNYGLWHHICVTWKSNGGVYRMYKDGNLRYQGVNLRSGETILGNGVVVLGQHQGKYGGGFHKYYSYKGEMTSFNMWSEAIESEEIKKLATTPCDRGCGDIINWSYLTPADLESVELAETEMACSPEVPRCFGGDYRRKTWSFDSTTVNSFVTVDKTIPDLSEFTMCFWMRTNDRSNFARMIVSYFTYGDSVGSIALEYVHNMRMWVSNQAGTFSGMELNYGLWHHVFVAWTSTDGVYKYYKDGDMELSGINLTKDRLIRGGGTMVIGQRLANTNGQFSGSYYAYQGELSDFNLWKEKLRSSEIEAIAENGCLKACGNLVWWPSFKSEQLTEVGVSDSDRQCPSIPRCSGGKYANSLWRFDNTYDWSYATVPKELPDLDEFTVCWWQKMNETPTSNYFWSTIMGYFAIGDYSYGSIDVINPNNLGVYIKNQWSGYTNVKVNDGRWHYLCMTWESDGGIFKLYDRGQRMYSASNIASGQTIRGGGSLVIGQLQSGVGTGFLRPYAFNGKIMYFNIWTRALDANEIKEAGTTRSCDPGCGDLFSWHEFTPFDIEGVTATKIQCDKTTDGGIEIIEKEDEMTTMAPAQTTVVIEPTTTIVEPTTVAAEPTTVAVEPTTVAAEQTTVAVEPTTVAAEPTTVAGKPSTVAVDEPTTAEPESKKTSKPKEQTTEVHSTATSQEHTEGGTNAHIQIATTANTTAKKTTVSEKNMTTEENQNKRTTEATGEVTTASETTTLSLEFTTKQACPVPDDLPNAAEGKLATQSSRKGGSKADRAVDGNTNSDALAGKSCTQTTVENRPWWKVDLGKSQNVYKVTITNRQDCCAEELLNAEVRVGDDDDFNNNAMCGTQISADVVNQETIEVICACGDPLSGRYISVQLPGIGSLALCEVAVGGLPMPTLEPEVTTEVCLLPENLDSVATGKTAVQSSQKGGSKAGRAVDGNTDSNFRNKSCSRTTLESEPWWMVDLSEIQDVYKVTLINRQDCCADKLLNAEVRVGNSENIIDNAVCGVRVSESTTTKETIDIICACGQPVTGRYVSVQLIGVTEELTLCEVEVSALPSAVTSAPSEDITTSDVGLTTDESCTQPDGLVNIATNMIATQISTVRKSIAGKAVDGNFDSNFKGKSCTQTEKSLEPWWKLDLGQERGIYGVTITNRMDCCSSRLKEAEIRIGNSENMEENTQCGIRRVSGKMAKREQIHIICNSCQPLIGRYVSIRLKRDKEMILTLCEVEVLAMGEAGPTAMATEPWSTLARMDTTPVLETTPITTEPPCVLPPVVEVASGLVQTSQSSVRRGAVAIRAVDGNKDGNFKTGRSCTMTKKEYEPWWMIDLEESRDIHMITISNREDCCYFRLKAAEIRVGNSPNFEENAVCGGGPLRGRDARERTVNVTCGCDTPLNGRYVSIQLIDRTQFLTLCEVEVWAAAPPEECQLPGGLIELASGNQVSQSSTKRKLGAEKAIDGDKNSDYNALSCTQTASELSPWWKVDLGESKDVYQVIITNRMDCCSWRLDSAEIRIGDSENISENALCGEPLSRQMVDKETIAVRCGCEAMKGKYVSIQLQDMTQVLTLCEVEIMGFP
uniref:Uncharacterized protein LOC100373294 n=1 Tax=Saccoglossus kowalevskii TaxID=10224 RepID=A0ABM0GZV8_SACKO|nr:PREDICTED: uncharacterized protein LOC100373294 [Saccoglossus kowalevskii]